MPIVLAAAAAAAALAFMWFRADDDSPAAKTGLLEARDPGPVHVHGLGVNPKDGALFIATHTGLYRLGNGETKPARVGDRRQDTMGFTVVGPDRFLGSGHPDVRDPLPPLLGLIESRDAGRTWTPVSLLGEADFHVLRFSGSRIYGFDATSGRILVSGASGRRWSERPPPARLLDLVVDPRDSEHVVAATERGLYESVDGGRTWTPRDDAVGLLAWPAGGRMYLVAADGSVLAGLGAGGPWRRTGNVGGAPAAFTATRPRELYVALHDGTIKRSRDGGATWTVRASP